MHRISGLIVGVLLLLCATHAWAQPPQGLYISGNIGFGIRSDASATGIPGGNINNDPAFVINGAIGAELNPMIRVEGEIGYHLNSADALPFSPNEFTFSMVSFMANGYFDIPTNSPLRPYLGAGVGFGLAGVDEERFGLNSTDSDMVGAFQLMTGIGFDFSPRATFTFGYRYFTTTDPDFFTAFGPFEMDYTSHDFLFGARFRF